MITTSVRVSPDIDGKSGAGSAVLAHSELAGIIGVQACAIAIASSASPADGCVGEGLHRGEMEIRFCQLRHLRRAAEASLTLATLDPADLVAELARNPDVVVLALRHMENIRLLVAEGRLPALVEGEEFGVRLGNAGVVGTDRVMERISERMRIG